MKRHPANNTLFVLATTSVLATALLLSVVMVMLLQPQGKLTCASFSSYEDALGAYKAGATHLDGNDKDGQPCEALKHL